MTKDKDFNPLTHKTMAEKKETVASLTWQLNKTKKELEETTSRLFDFYTVYISMMDKQAASAEATSIGECVVSCEYPIVITNAGISYYGSRVLSQGRVYRLFYDEGKERKMLYFAPKAYYPAERLLECYFVIATSGKDYEHLFIPECVHGLQYYNSFEALFPNWAQSRDCMLPLDFDNMFVVDFLLDIEFDNVKAMAKQVNPKYQLLKEIMPNQRGGLRVRLALPDYEHLKKKALE